MNDAMYHLQQTTQSLYRAYRATPSPEGLRLLQVAGELLREVTGAAKRAPKPRLPILHVDSEGRVLRLSLS